MVSMLTECQCNYTLKSSPSLWGWKGIFSVWCYLGRCFWRNTGSAILGTEEIRITENLLNKKFSVLPHSWRPTIATQLEKLEAERREILWFDLSSLYDSWCVQNASGFCEVQDTEYLCLPQQYFDLYIELSAQILEGGIGRPVPWDILGVKFFEDTWVDYAKGSLIVSQGSDIYIL